MYGYGESTMIRLYMGIKNSAAVHPNSHGAEQWKKATISFTKK